MFGPSAYDSDDYGMVELPASPPKQLYHVTHIKNLQSIKKKGLVPKVGEITRSAHGDPQNPASPMVYLSDRVAPGILHKLKKDALIISVNPNDNDIWLFTGDQIVEVNNGRWGHSIEEGDFPVGIEPGDFYSESTVTPDKFYDYQGKEIKDSVLAANDDDGDIGKGKYALTTDKSGKFWGNAGAGGIFYAKDTKRFLLAYRSAYVNEPHTWGVWGGALDKEETPLQAIQREVEEETRYSGKYKLVPLFVYKKGEFQYNNFVILVEKEFEPHLDWETEKYGWFTLDEFPTPLHFGLKALLPHLKGLKVESKVHAAKATDKFKSKIYYHGTPTILRANAAWKEGIRPDLSKIPATNISRPVAGRVYVTDSLKYAIIYALGGDFAGSDCETLIKMYGKYGYLFVIDGQQLQADIQPDEDQIGEAVYLNQQDSTKFPWIRAMAIEHIQTEDAEDDYYRSLLHAVKDGLYDAWIKTGHILLPYLTGQQKFEIMEHFGNIAHLGLIKPKEMWEFDRSNCKQLKRDGSNFFELAKLKEKTS